MGGAVRGVLCVCVCNLLKIVNFYMYIILNVSISVVCV